MMTPVDVLNALRELGTENAIRCIEAVEAGLVKALFPPLGRMVARKAVQLFDHRRQTAAKAGIRIEGLDDSLAAMRQRADDDTVFLAGFAGHEVDVVVFLDERGGALGCGWIDGSSRTL